MNWKTIQSLGLGGALAGLSGAALIGSLFPGLSVLAWVAVPLGAWLPLQSAWESLRARSLDVNVLMVLAAAASLGLGMPLEAGILLFLFTLSGALETFALGRTRAAVESLVALRPET
ncbi:MAG: hypothetical protein MH204_03140, partial [Fimbriimonadaceae bacterium]|nr:hypothetical protein [Fimbriimonadaceae bacterium]